MGITWAIAAGIILLLVVLYQNSDESLRKGVTEELSSSRGNLDAPAERALAKNMRISRPKPRDLFHRGRILQYWVAENEPGHPGYREARKAYADAAAAIQENMQARLTAEDLENALILERILDLPDTPDILDIPGTPNPAGLAEAPAAALREARVQEAFENTGTARGAALLSLAEAHGFANDAQNVHDSSVVSDLARTYERIKIPEDGRGENHHSSIPSNGGLPRKEAIDSAIAEISLAAQGNPEAARVLEVVKGDAQVSGFRDGERAILAAVWLRAKAPENRGRSEEIREAILLALEDSWENGGTVCTAGRAARYLGALAGVDADPAMGAAATVDAYKNEIYTETMKIVAEHSRAGTPAALEYAGKGGPASELERAEFSRGLREAITANISRYSSRLSPQQISRITEDCLVYAMLEN